MKKILLIGLALLFLGGGGAAGYFFLLAPKDDGVVEAPPVRLPKSSEFVEIDPLTLPVLRGGKVSTVISLRIVLELGPERTIADIRTALPRLQDASITQLSSLLSLNWPAGAVLDLETAKARLLERYQRVVGPEIIVGVLIRDMVERKA